MKKYIQKSTWSNNFAEELRIVNQPEIVDYITKNPGKTENQIMEDVYGYVRELSCESNKKYAECLRRALDKGSINRVKAQTSVGKRYIYFAR